VADHRRPQRKAKPAGAKQPPSATVTRRRKIWVRGALVLAAAVVVLFVVVLPLRTLLDQRGETDHARDVLKLLKAQNAQLDADARRLQDDAEVERIARELYGMVRPGETPYVPVPAPTTTAPTASTTATTSP
jgi:cell division protein FtsB